MLASGKSSSGEPTSIHRYLSLIQSSEVMIKLKADRTWSRHCAVDVGAVTRGGAAGQSGCRLLVSQVRHVQCPVNVQQIDAGTKVHVVRGCVKPPIF